ncbi:ubiquinone-dependent pyruvate dehydrogenase [Endozoicomonas sp. ONNA2]|uniref:ubiquinone-dependent pyruvate dehydrogenase n=1 Tax=Endozoicomonas sp. ONNA2 TaxID=2828741 RepID=UPI0021471E48|nr:ubiquinone-dependent pyruvate dehydrogenase [Endozoicomonas sp. ONNA2]
MNIAQYMVSLFHHAGVQRIWGITGDSLNGLADSLRADGHIEWIGVRHEEVAAFAAGAEAEISGKLAVCAGSCGPGNLHLINGLYNCYRNSVPVLAIAADIPSSESGTRYFQETDPGQLFAGCSIFCEKITTAQQMPQVLETAMRQAILKRSVSVLILPGDIALTPLPTKIPIKWQAPQPPLTTPDGQLIKLAADILNNCEKVTLMCGAGCQNAHDEVIALARTLNAPIVHALRGKEFIEYDNPYDVGMTGLIGFASGYQAMENADVLLLLGTSFPYRHFYPKHSQVIQVDRAPEAIGRHVQVDLGIVSDVLAALSVLQPLLIPKASSQFLQKCQQHYQASRKKLDAEAKNRHASSPIHPQTLACAINQKASDTAIFICDVGTPTLWAARYLKTNGHRRLIGSFNHGSMANALAQALGAQMVDRQRQVIAFCGDGGFSMLMGDLLTLKPYNLPVKIVILNNSSLGFVDLEMKAAGFVSKATNLDNPCFSAIASACGMQSCRVSLPNELSPAIDDWLHATGPSVLEVVTDRHELSFPPKMAPEYAKGFGLYSLKAVINGYGDELLELAKVNLFR